MKLSKPLSISILILSVLLLCVAKNANAQPTVVASPNPPGAQNHEAKPETNPDVHERQPPGIPDTRFETEVIKALRSITDERESARARDQANEKRWWPPSSGWAIVYVTIAYSFIAVFTLCAINRQAGIANKNLLLQFRPKLIVRNVVVPPRLEATDVRPNLIYYFARNELVQGQCYVSNIGGTRATITESHCIVYWTKGALPMRRPYEGDNGNNPITGTIEAGGRATMRFTSTEPLPVGQLQIGMMTYTDSAPAWFLFVMGWIEYADDLGFERRTSFCRKFDPTIDRFVVVNDPDYEIVE